MSRALGELQPYSSVAGNAGYGLFETDDGMSGLAVEAGDTVEILAVMSEKPGTGQFRRLIETCKKEFREIRVIEIWNKELISVLKRYGFHSFKRTDAGGERITGMCWKNRGQS